MNRPFSRRAALGAGAAVVAGVGVSPALAESPVPSAAPSVPVPASPDAELIRLCARVVEIERFVDDYSGIDDIDECPVLGPMVQEQDAIMGRLYVIPAQTAEGYRAKAAVVQAILADHAGCGLYDHGRMAMMLAGDVLWLAGSVDA